MKIAFITNLRAPYRTLQLNEYSKIKGVTITAYYCNDKRSNRKWKIESDIDFNEIDLNGIEIFKKYGYINKGLIKIVKNNDLIIIGGYDQPTYILISIICKFFKRKYILLFDGISTNRITDNENYVKKIIKRMVISGSSFILGNGKVSKRYFNEVFNYPEDRIYNQYLSVDGEKINSIFKNREKYRKFYRRNLGIEEGEKVLIYSGRLIDIKNVHSIIKAISYLGKEDLTFLVTGGGELEESILKLAEKLNVKIRITGFISEQDELFKHYCAGDALILASLDEPWGLVINEAMFSGLPVIVSEICGCAWDLVDGNGFLINPSNIIDISEKISRVLYSNELELLGKKSRQQISEWSFENSRKQLEKIILKI